MYSTFFLFICFKCHVILICKNLHRNPKTLTIKQNILEKQYIRNQLFIRKETVTPQDNHAYKYIA